MALLVISMLVLLILGIPIAYAIGISSLLYVVLLTDMSPLVVAQQISAGADTMVLLALPFFLLASFILFWPGAIASLMPMELPSKYFVFALGLAIYLGVVLVQKMRMSPAPAPDEAH